MNRLLFIIAQVVWGFPQTLMGFVVFLLNIRRPHFRYHGAIVTTWKSRKALTAGPFVFLNGSDDACDAKSSVSEPLLVHEYGHTIQSLALGPLYLLIIGLPSAVWLTAPVFVRMRKRTGVSYYAFFTERWANALGERVLGLPAAGSERK